MSFTYGNGCGNNAVKVNVGESCGRTPKTTQNRHVEDRRPIWGR
jgi:hypothetical protein